ncbi:MAG TPA: class I SAM-dependent methyltransferase [Mycobacterium sp.]|nr:class I SAM-dependent methyltransferase [Mycobacterium sp.]
MPTLDDLAIRHGTDKSSLAHHYTKIYERYLDRRRAITLLELGVWEGESLRMWREYLPHATIIGVDKHDRGIQVDGTHIYVADQADVRELGLIADRFGGFDVIIDDASHISSKTIASFQILYRHLRPGGLYFVEDLQTSYDPVNYGRSEASQDPDQPPVGPQRWTAMQFCQRLADEVNRGLYPTQYLLGYPVDHVAFWPNLCMIRKAADA